MARRNIKASGWNWHDTKTQFQKELLAQSSKVNAAALSILADAQKAFINDLPAQEAPEMPFISGNLHDSIAGVISVAGGRVVKATLATPVARTPSIDTGKMRYSPSSMAGGRRVYGHMEALRAVYGSRAKTYPSGIAATLIVAAPYAENPNEISARNKTGRHAGYLDILGSRYVKNIERAFKLYDYYDLFRWKGAPLSWDTPILK